MAFMFLLSKKLFTGEQKPRPRKWKLSCLMWARTAAIISEHRSPGH